MTKLDGISKEMRQQHPEGGGGNARGRNARTTTVLNAGASPSSLVNGLVVEGKYDIIAEKNAQTFQIAALE